MRLQHTLCFVSLFVATATVANGASALAPTSELVSSRPVQDLALTRGSVGYVADVPKRLSCGRIGFWNRAARTSFTVDAKEQCVEEASTGQGIWDVSVATRRLLWLTYAGGNFREWTLWTATTTRRTPRRLRFVARDVDAPPPIVVGPGTTEGIAYAVDREVVYLGDNGKAIFKTTLDAPVRAIASGRGPRGIRVAALQGDHVVVGLDRDGRQVVVWEYTRSIVTAIRVSWRGLVVQAGDDVYIGSTRIPLLSGATMVDVGQGRILWERAGDLGATTIATSTSERLVDGTPLRPAYGQLEPQGIAWSVGRFVRWRAGSLP